MTATVTIYTRALCGYCWAATRLLRKKGVAFEEIDATGDNATRAWLAQVTGRTTVPQVFINGKSVGGADDLRADLFRKTQYWRDGLAEAGFDLLPGETAIVPVMLGEATLAQAMAAELDKRGVFVAGFFFPVVPRGQARIRTQMNAAIAMEDLDIALQAFREAGKETGVI